MKNSRLQSAKTNRRTGKKWTTLNGESIRTTNHTFANRIANRSTFRSVLCQLPVLYIEYSEKYVTVPPSVSEKDIFWIVGVSHSFFMS